MRTCKQCGQSYNANILARGEFGEGQVHYSICPHCGAQNDHWRTIWAENGRVISEDIK